MGNINLNIHNENMLQLSNYLNAVKCNEVLHLITKPTRVTENSATALDMGKKRLPTVYPLSQ